MNPLIEKMEDLEAFVFYPTFWLSFLDIPEPEDRAVFLEAVCRYGVTGEYTELKWPLNTIFHQCMVSLEAARNRYESSSRGGKASSTRKITVTGKEIEQARMEYGSMKAACEKLGISTRSGYNILNGSAEKENECANRADKCAKVCRQVNKNTNIKYSQGDADKLRSREKETKEMICGSQDDPEKISEALAQEPPAGCEWIGEPYMDDGDVCRPYNESGTTNVGVARFRQ